MTDSGFPRPLSDPESDGLPGVADDDSNAFDEVDSVRGADGPRPAALPGNRGVPSEGHTLAQRLAEEEPDVSSDGRWSEPGRPIGRLVDTADGGYGDDEPQALAWDAGAAGGGASAEEYAMHEIVDEDEDDFS
jgi:Family of unknown function (DUF5709)